MNIADKQWFKLCVVLINYYNDSDTIECVQSILASEKIDLPFLIIVENGDQNSSLPAKINFYPSVKFLFPGQNMGFANGNNLAFAWAKANLDFDYMLILNNDTLLLKDTLYKLIKAADDNSSFPVITPCIITTDPSPKIWYSGGSINYWKITPAIGHIEEVYSSEKLTSGPVIFASGCAMLLTKLFLANNSKIYDPHYFIYDEDLDFSIMIRNIGQSVLFYPEAVVIHKCQGSSSDKTRKVFNQLSVSHPDLLFYLKNTIGNRYYLIRKYFNGLTYINLLFKITFYWLMKSVQYLLHFKITASITVVKEVVRSLLFIRS